MKTAEEILIETESKTGMDLAPYNIDFVLAAMEQFAEQFKINGRCMLCDSYNISVIDGGVRCNGCKHFLIYQSKK